MRRDLFNYDLPAELVAQTPIDRREQSRLLCIDKATGKTSHRRFVDLPELLRPGDCLVLNDSRVLPARLFGFTKNGGSVEVVLLRDTGGDIWECLTRPGKKTKTGTVLGFGCGELSAVVTDEVEGGNRLLKFSCDGLFLETLDRLGKMPLPPYIREELKDGERYQTVRCSKEKSTRPNREGLMQMQSLQRVANPVFYAFPLQKPY